MDAIKDKEKHFKVKIEESIVDYLGCEIVMDEAHGTAWIGRTFGDLVKGVQSHRMPGTPHQAVERPTEEHELITVEKKKVYRTGVGMLLYLTKYSSPDISNAVRELTKYMHKSTPMAYKEILRVVNFVLDTTWV